MVRKQERWKDTQEGRLADAVNSENAEIPPRLKGNREGFGDLVDPQGSGYVEVSVEH